MLLKGAHFGHIVRVPPSTTNTIMASIVHYECTYKPIFLLLLLFAIQLFSSTSAQSEQDALLKFKDSLTNVGGLTGWSNESQPCNKAKKWIGVICHEEEVTSLKLEDMELAGKIDVKALTNLKRLRSLSLMNNKFDGPLPDFKGIVTLRSIFLSGNKFVGEIPKDAFEGLFRLRKVILANNQFTGEIPSSLTNLPKLITLELENNRFTGKIPNLNVVLTRFNVSNNQLNGSIPHSVSKFDQSCFSGGNEGLCGRPLKDCGSDSDAKANNKKPPSTATIVMVCIIAVIAIVAIVGAAFILFYKRRGSSSELESIESPAPSNLQKKAGLRGSGHKARGPESGNVKKVAGSESSKVLFVREDRERFDLQELLKAPAEILGSGCFGSSYKAALSSGSLIVVKRFKQMNNVAKEDFHEHMRRLGRLTHPNLLPLVAYCYRKEEKLLVTDHVERGSLAMCLHGHQSLGQPTLDWPTRLKIVKGVAHGLAYLHKEVPCMIAAHGHLKSSNVLLNEAYDPFLTDYGLVPVINQEDSQNLMVAYKSPEYLEHGRITKKTDVWSLGVLILEILTGKFPSNFLQQGKGNKEDRDLASWVNSVGEEMWTTEVLDKELVKAGWAKGSEVEIVKLLRIGLQCCVADLEKRVELKEAVEMIDKIEEKDNSNNKDSCDDDFYSSIASDADKHSTRGKSDDFEFS